MKIKQFLLLIITLFAFQTIAPAQNSAEKRLSFTVDAAHWNITLPAENLSVEQQEVKPDGKSAYFALSNAKSRLVISFYIEPAVKCKDGKSCRDFLWKSGNPLWQSLKNVVQTEKAGIGYLEFLLPEYQGTTINQQNIYAEYVKDNFWVDLHVSKIFYKPEERELFEQVIKSLKFAPKKTNPSN